MKEYFLLSHGTQLKQITRIYGIGETDHMKTWILPYPNMIGPFVARR